MDYLNGFVTEVAVELGIEAAELNQAILKIAARRGLPIRLSANLPAMDPGPPLFAATGMAWRFDAETHASAGAPTMRLNFALERTTAFPVASQYFGHQDAYDAPGE